MNYSSLLLAGLIVAFPARATLAADYLCVFDTRNTISTNSEPIEAEVTLTATSANEFAVWDGIAQSFATVTQGDDFISFTEVFSSGGLITTTIEKIGGSAVRHHHGWMRKADWPLIESSVTFFGRCEVSQ